MYQNHLAQDKVLAAGPCKHSDNFIPSTINHHHKHQGLDQFDPFRLQSYNCSRQRFFGLPVVLLPCGLKWYDFKGIRFCGILCKSKCQFSLHSSILSSMPVIFISRSIKYITCYGNKGKFSIPPTCIDQAWPSSGRKCKIYRQQWSVLYRVWKYNTVTLYSVNRQATSSNSS